MHVLCSMSFHGQFMAHKDPALLLLKIKSDVKLHGVFHTITIKMFTI